MAIGAFSLLVLGIPAVASAQWSGGQYDPYGRNGGNNNGGYNNGGYNDQRSTVRGLKDRARQFANVVDRELDRSRNDGTRREDRINEAADRFKDAVNDLDNNGRYNERKVRRVMDAAGRVDRVIGRARLGGNAENLWYSIRNDLRYLGGNAYYDDRDDRDDRDDDYNRNNRNNRNNRYPQNRNGRNNLPSWWPF